MTGLVAETRVRQTYVNTLGVPLEATYIFPLPDRAAVSAFRFEVGERVIEGTLKERGRRGRTTIGRSRRGIERPSARRSGRASSRCASAT